VNNLHENTPSDVLTEIFFHGKLDDLNWNCIMEDAITLSLKNEGIADINLHSAEIPNYWSGWGDWASGLAWRIWGEKRGPEEINFEKN